MKRLPTLSIFHLRDAGCGDAGMWRWDRASARRATGGDTADDHLAGAGLRKYLKNSEFESSTSTSFRPLNVALYASSER